MLQSTLDPCRYSEENVTESRKLMIFRGPRGGTMNACNADFYSAGKEQRQGKFISRSIIKLLVDCCQGFCRQFTSSLERINERLRIVTSRSVNGEEIVQSSNQHVFQFSTKDLTTAVFLSDSPECLVIRFKEKR